MLAKHSGVQLELESIYFSSLIDSFVKFCSFCIFVLVPVLCFFISLYVFGGYGCKGLDWPRTFFCNYGNYGDDDGAKGVSISTRYLGAFADPILYSHCIIFLYYELLFYY